MSPEEKNSSTCQCTHPDLVIEGNCTYCAWCGGDVPAFVVQDLAEERDRQSEISFARSGF